MRRNPNILQPSVGQTIQAQMTLVASTRPPQAVQQDCSWFGDACCRLMSSGVWRCSFPGGACTPGLEACPAWLTNEIKRQSQLASSSFSAAPVGVPVPSAVRRLRAQQRRMMALVASRARLGI